MKPSKAAKALWLVGLAILPLGILHVVHWLDRPNTALDAYRIDRMRIVESHAARPPIDAEWREIDGDTYLPASIKRDRFNSSWVAIDPPFPASGQDQLAIYLRHPMANVAVYLDSVFIGSGGAMERPLPFYVRPLLFRLPFADRESQTVYLRIARENSFITPNAVFIGPAALLSEEYDTARLYGLWIPAIVATLMLGLAMAMGVLYVLSKREFTYYGIYAVIVLLYAMHTIHSTIDRIPIHHWTWFTIIYLLLWWVILSPAFANRFFDLKMHGLERFVLATGAVLTLPILGFLVTFRLAELYSYFALVWVPYVLLCALIAVLQYARASLRDWSFESVGMYAVGALAFVVGVRDHLFDFTAWIPGTMFYTKYVATAQIAFISLIVARRYTSSARELVTLNLELEDRIEDKARELEEGYEKRRVLEREQTLSRERERLMRDMHDGLGGQLIQALAMSEKDEAPAELRDSLEQALIDLRLIVDSIAPEQNDLIALLASFRHRSKKVWEKSGVKLRWDMADVQPTALGPERSLNVLRIVQEATTNALRHGKARNIRVSARALDGEVCVEISDDGVGFDTASASRGFGLANMRRRAQEANLGLEIESDASGTRVRICIPQ